MINRSLIVRLFLLLLFSFSSTTFAKTCSKIVELEEELRVVGNNLKSLEVSEEKVWQGVWSGEAKGEVLPTPGVFQCIVMIVFRRGSGVKTSRFGGKCLVWGESMVEFLQIRNVEHQIGATLQILINV